MPEISRFFGIIILMYYDEHNPPHFHARYGSDKAAIEIASLRVLVVEWASQHQEELMTNWEAARNDRPPTKIPPLQ